MAYTLSTVQEDGMPYWVMKARLDHALRELSKMHTNIAPRLRILRERLGRSGAIAESYELENILSYFDLKLRAAYAEIEQDRRTIDQLTMGLPAMRTTPLLYATDDERYTS